VTVVTTRPHPSLDLVWRSILPSVTSVSVCLFAGIVTVLFGILATAGQQGATVGFQPVRVSFADGFSRMLTRSSWSDILSIVLGVLVLSFVFAGLEFLFGSYAKFRDTAKKGVPAAEGSPLGISELRWLLKRMFWRMIVGLIAVVAAALLVQLTTWVSAAEKTSITALSFAHNAQLMTISCLVWALVYYAVIVFLRLYTYRANIF
jgi:hypothetical protein